MVAKAEEVVAKLKSSDAATRLKAIRDMKNQIIGNRSRKKAFVKLSAISRIVDMLAVGSESQFQIQCATVVGSLARLDKQSAIELSQAGGITLLSKMLDSVDESVVEAGLRALNFYFEAHLAKKEGKVNLPLSSMTRCSELLDSSNLQIRGQAARLIYFCAHDPSMKVSLQDVGVIGKLTGILESDLPDSVIHPAIMALCALPDGEDVRLQWSSACVARLLKRIKTHPQAKIQLDCCTCITFMCADCRCPESKEVLRKCLAVLARLITENQWPPYEFRAYSVLGALLKMEEGLVAPARDSGIVHALACRLASSDVENFEVEVSLLNALATLIDGSEEGRKQLVDLVGDKAIQRVIKGMRSGDRATQLACFDVMRALSRSACYLRQLQARFRECAALCMPFLETGTSVDMQVRACALLCNLVLGFSPARETALEAGCVEKLGQLVGSKEAEVALHALWALGNVTRLSVRAERFRVIDALPAGGRLLELATRSPDQDIKIRAMVLLQNLTSDCSTATNLAALEKWLGMSGLLIPEALLEPDEHQSTLQLVPAVNATNNIINALQKRRELEGKDLAPLVDRLKALLSHESSEVVAGTLWVVKSLVKGGSSGQASGECVRLLEEKQVWEIVSRLYDSTDQLDVRERAKTVLAMADKISEPDAMEED